jgi:hypothetical protein
METVEQSPVFTIEELQEYQHRYCETINEEDYQMYLNIVENHNRAKSETQFLMSGDVMIAKSLDEKKKYNRGHIEYRNSDDSFGGGEIVVCVQPYTPFVHCTEKGEEFSANGVSGGYFFRPGDDEEIELVGFRLKDFCTFGRNGGQADGAFHFPLLVNVWEVKSKEVY